MPDHPDAAVARRSARPAPRFVAPAFLGDCWCGLLGLRGANGLGHRHLDGVVLVVTRHLLGYRAAAIVVEYDKVPHQGQEPVGRADALQHHLQLGHAWVGQGLAGDGAPRLEPLPPSGEGTDARLGPVGDHEHFVHGEESGQLSLVGLELLPSGPDGGVLVGGVLELDDAQGQAVDEEYDVGTAGVLILPDGELVDGQPVVVGGIVEVDDPRLRPEDGAVSRAVLHRHAVHQHPVGCAVAGFQGRPLRMGKLAEGVAQRCDGQVWVQL